MTLHIDIETSQDVEIKEIGITRANEYTEISLGKGEKKRSEGITHYSFWVTRNTSAILSLADEIEIKLSDDTEVTGYSISVDGIAINRPVVFFGDWVEISPDLETVEVLMTNFFESGVSLTDEIEDVKGTISNERLWGKGSSTDEERLLHAMNIATQMEYLNRLERMKRVVECNPALSELIDDTISRQAVMESEAVK